MLDNWRDDPGDGNEYVAYRGGAPGDPRIGEVIASGSSYEEVCHRARGAVSAFTGFSVCVRPAKVVV